MRQEARWMTNYRLLVSYQKRYGDALVPSNHVEFLPDGREVHLGSWVSYMRTRYKSGKLPPDKVRKLEEIPTWDWGPVRPGPKSQEEIEERDDLIRKMYRSGNSLSIIGKKYSLSRQRIHQIVKESK